ncbi:MAG TPA: prolyl oligopeptidase family serine peptidase [Candidatus Limnocylindrales bacterium]
MLRHYRRTIAAGLLITVIALGVAAGAQLSYGAYDRLTSVPADCGGGYEGSTPASFKAGIDTAPFLMPDYSEVRFPSRDPGIAIDAWWVPGPSLDAPAVVLAHGLGECKRATSVLLPAGMLHSHGYAVLVIDLRDEGSSTVDNGRFAGGAGEARDILGGWDWLRNEKGIPAPRIGLFGISLGAGAAILAMGQEPKVAATWEDSGYADLVQTLRHQESARGLQPVLVDLGVAVSRLLGTHLATRPVDALDDLAGRPIALVCGKADRLVPLEQAQQLSDAARAHGNPTIWIVPGVGHTGAMGNDPAEYERRLLAFFDGSLGGTGSTLSG